MYLILTLGICAFVVSLVLTPLVRRLARRWKLFDHPDGRRKCHKEPIPRIGGVAIAIAYLASFGLVFLLPFSYRQEFESVFPSIWKLCAAATLIFLTGLLDDLVGLRPWQKLVEQLVAAGMAFCAGVQIHLWPDHPWALLWNIPLSLVWIMACTNAFNLIDGLDGLAAGVGLFATTTIIIAAFLNDTLPLALVTVPLAGALLGFLRYNFNPASVFLGDSGSLLIGFLLGCYGAMWSQKSATMIGLTAPLMVVAIPLMDVCLSIVRRYLRNQPIFGADRGHIHHRLLDRGFTPRKVALLLYAITGLAAAMSLLQTMFEHQFGGLIIVLFAAMAWIGIQHLGYVEFDMARRLFLGGNFRRLIDAQARVCEFEAALLSAPDMDSSWEVLTSACETFQFERVSWKCSGELREHRCSYDFDGALWELRIPLATGDYINFYRRFDLKVESAVLSSFAGMARTALLKKTPALEPLIVEAARQPEIAIARGASG